jgi:ubiquinone/menaquinone biosynthesis C-methylase UbiE
VANVYDLPIHDQSFDLIYMITVINEINEIPDIPRELAEFHRVLKPSEPWYLASYLWTQITHWLKRSPKKSRPRTAN